MGTQKGNEGSKEEKKIKIFILNGTADINNIKNKKIKIVYLSLQGIFVKL